MDSLIALGIGENRCPTEAQWAEFCIISAVVVATTGNSLIIVPISSVSLNDVEEHSWDKFWKIFGDYNISNERPRILTLDLIESLRWRSGLNPFPDCFNDKTCNVRLCYLKRGREVLNTFSEEIKKNIESISKFIPLILKEVNIAIKQ